MNILLDECVPRKFKEFFVGGHTCKTVPEAGFAGKRNGELLRSVEGLFDVFITLDKGLPFQQNLGRNQIAVVVLRARSNRLADVAPFAPACVRALRTAKPGELLMLDSGSD